MLLLLSLLDVTVLPEDDSHVVEENEGSASICAVILDPTEREVVLSYSTLPNTAAGMSSRN